MNTKESMTIKEKLAQSKEEMETLLVNRKPSVGIILGSGLGDFAHEIKDPIQIPFEQISFMGKSTANSHVGQFVCGMIEGHCVLAMQGRLHGYEGYSAQEVAYPVWLMHELGITTLITTNAAGAINQSYRVGDFCIMYDHINFTGRNPIANREATEIGPRFFSLYHAYDEALRKCAMQVAQSHDIRAHEGVYLAVLGPSFETAAEIRMFGDWGADTVAMSVVEEVIAARQVGMRVMGMSLCTNMGCGIEASNPDDEEVVEVAAQKLPEFSTIIKGVVASI